MVSESSRFVCLFVFKNMFEIKQTLKTMPKKISSIGLLFLKNKAFITTPHKLSTL